ncbi:MAG TPA: XrtA system polysaccharide deacetylase [Gemmataceae bacterium]|nr:XrtA system polysaccharide deacetylase [Gemmataceae bacterium]
MSVADLPRPATGGSTSAAAPPLNALTIDVEDYFHATAFEGLADRARWDDFAPRVEAGTRRILELLDRAGVRGTFFVLGWVAERHPRLVRAIHGAGHELACHGYWHRLVYAQTPEEFRTDLRRARAAIEDAAGERVTAYRAPSFSVTRRSLWALDVLIDEGFRVDSSIYPTYHDRYGVAGAPLAPHRIRRPGGWLREFPPSVCRVLGYPLPVGGGGYFRLYPYRMTRSALRAVNRAGRPFVAYLHPWELDPEQPRMPVGRLTAFRHYVNLRRTAGRLARLLRDFPLGPLSESLARWEANHEPLTWDLSQPE